MMDFSTTTLAELTTDGKGSYGIAASAVDFSDALYTYLRITDIRDDGTLNKDDLKSVDDERASQYILNPNDIVFARTGASTGRNYFYDGSDGQFVYAGFLIKFSIDPKKVNPKYVKYYCMSDMYKGWVHSFNTGSTRGNINAKTLGNMVIPIPSRKQQDGIVNILSSIDEKVKENNEINKNLQAQAQAVFLHLFADNESVIPASIADVALNVTDGVHNTVHDDPDGEYLLLSCKNIKGGSLSIGTSERRINAETFEKLRRRTKLAKGDVLISSVGTVGELLLVNTEPSNYEFQRSVAMVKPNPDIVSPVYLYEALLSQKAELINAAHGAVQQCLFISDIAGFPIGIPTQDDLLTFDEVVTPMFDTITANEAESIRLAALRDALLPKLMCGEIDVSDLDL